MNEQVLKLLACACMVAMGARGLYLAISTGGITFLGQEKPTLKDENRRLYNYGVAIQIFVILLGFYLTAHVLYPDVAVFPRSTHR